MSRRRFPLWTLFGVVVVVALVVGSGVFSSAPPTAAARAAAIESVVRCPTCEDLSVAQSSAPTAVAVRASVARQIAAGRTDQQIEAYLVDRYGSSIVLDPPASGWTLLVWLIPLLGGLVATAVVVTVLVRRRNATEGGADRSGPEPTDPRQAEERRRFLTQSLADADAEYLAGDLSDRDYLSLRQRDLARLAALGPAPVTSGPVPVTAGPRAGSGALALDDRRTLAASTDTAADPEGNGPNPDPEVSAPPRRRLRRSTWFLVAGCTCIAAALVVAVLTFAGSRQPGQSITGSFAETSQQQVAEDLTQAATDENGGQLAEAATLYRTVLATHPDNEVATAQLGWLEVETGQDSKSTSLIADGTAGLRRAVRLNPHDYAAHLYLGTTLLIQDDDAAGAVAQYQQFLADGPPASLVSQAASEIRNAYSQTGQSPPAAVAG
jgi:cytochrome c-type biogenesis protein CcmH